MEKILKETSVYPKVTISEEEYNRLVSLARAKAKQIEERAVAYYEKNGVFKGDRLILTWETSKTPLDVKLVNQIIKHYLLE